MGADLFLLFLGGIGLGYLAVLACLIAVCWWLIPSREWKMGATLILLAAAVAFPPVFLSKQQEANEAKQQVQADAYKQRSAKARAMFPERCKTAGEKIYKTVDNVDGVFLMKLRPDVKNTGDQFKLDDPYGRDLDGKGYIETFVRGSYRLPQRQPYNPRPGWPLRNGYAYVEAIDPQDGQRYRYTGSMKVVGKMDANAPNVKVDLKRDPNFDLNIYRYVVDREPAPGKLPLYGVTYDDISTHEERENWIAGSSLKVVDLKTNEVIAERIGYMVDFSRGNWLDAANNACPDFHRFPNPVVVVPASSAQAWQAVDFVEKVLRPSLPQAR